MQYTRASSHRIYCHFPRASRCISHALLFPRCFPPNASSPFPSPSPPPLSHIHTIPQIITAFAVQEPLMYLILCTRGGLFRNPTHSDPPPPPMARFVRLWKIPNRVEVPWLSTTSGGRHRLSFLLTSCSACRLLISPSLPPPALSYQQVLSALNTIRWNVSLCPSLAGFN